MVFIVYLKSGLHKETNHHLFPIKATGAAGTNPRSHQAIIQAVIHTGHVFGALFNPINATNYSFNVISLNSQNSLENEAEITPFAIKRIENMKLVEWKNPMTFLYSKSTTSVLH